MKENSIFDVIIIGGSYAGLAAGMALGRSLKEVLIIDSGLPCNRQTPHSHNFITHDGVPPAEIARQAREQVLKYDTVRLLRGTATGAERTEHGFDIQVDSGETYRAAKLIFATGVRDLMPDLEGFAECWGITVIHCPYCHGYEVRNERTGILDNGDAAYDFAKFLSNWTGDLTLYTNGPSTLSGEQTRILQEHGIGVDERKIARLEHSNGRLKNLLFTDGSQGAVTALYAHIPFEQHCPLAQQLGCALTEEGYLVADSFQRTTVPGIYACGDNTTRMRSVASSVAMGTTAGAVCNRELIFERF